MCPISPRTNHYTPDTTSNLACLSVSHQTPPLYACLAQTAVGRVNTESPKMAESLSFIHFGAATKSPLAKSKEPKLASDTRPPSSRDIHPPPSKRVRNDEKSLKPKKLNGEGGAGGGGGAVEKQHQKQSSGIPTTWSFSPVKASSNPSAPLQPPIHTVFKQSAFLASHTKPPSKKTKEKREKEKDFKEKKKHKPIPGTPGNISGSLSNVTTVMKKENGEMKLLQKDHSSKDKTKKKKKHKVMNEIKRENGEVKLLQKDKQKPQINSELQIKKVKKKKKKHKESEREKEKWKHPKMYSRSSQTVCAGLLSELHAGLASKQQPHHHHHHGHTEFKPPLPVHHHHTSTTSSIKQENCYSPSPTLSLSKPLWSSSNSSSSSISSWDPASPMTSPLQIPQPRCPQPGFENLELARFIHVEEQPNGGALVAHAYCSELSALSPAEMQQFAQEFVTLAFSEDTSSQAAHYVMGIIHGAASYLPDFLDYFSWKFPSSPVKMEILGKKDIETTTMLNFHNQISRIGPGRSVDGRPDAGRVLEVQTDNLVPHGPRPGLHELVTPLTDNCPTATPLVSPLH
uniref:lysine-specific demethylase RSBN1L-like n=1 Tax=Oncorhynchus gorbuscha TaxID=8017 RepID=UPI001EAEE673|nr:lysine-specific demethylase RSBN1L-like [Oncorhynchus gorbuscha]